jgi:putative DNA primase/helicase
VTHAGRYPGLVSNLHEGHALAATDVIPYFALYYAQNFAWKLLACHGLEENGKCTCGATHTDPKDTGKHPAISNWQNDATSDLGTIEGWFRQNPRYNIGVMARNSGFLVLDIDPRSGGFETFNRFEEMVDGQIPPTVTALTGVYNGRSGQVRGKHLYFKVEGNEEFIGKLETISKDLKGIDVKYNGYLLLAPSRHVSGVQYEWEPGKAPWEIEMAAPSDQMMDTLRKRRGRTVTGGKNGDWEFVNNLEWNGTKLDLDRFMNDGIDEGSRAVDIYAMACALANKYGTDSQNRMWIETLMSRFNYEKVNPPLPIDGTGSLMMHVNRAIDFVAKNPKGPFISNNLGYNIDDGVMLRDSGAFAGFSHKNREREHTPLSGDPYTGDLDDFESEIEELSVMANFNVSKDVDAISSDDGGMMGSRSMTDTGNGRRLVDAYGTNIRYTPGLGWYFWNGNYWMSDVEELSVRELTKSLGSIIAAEAASYDNEDASKSALGWAKQAKSNARQAAAIEAATSDPRIGVPVEHWDNDPYLLGVANGVVDLRTGELFKGRPDLHITRRSPVKYSPGYTSSRFQEFLDYATFGDKEYQEWLQRAFGYTLTGRRDYDVMFVVYGPPGSGKNVFVEALVKCLGTREYAFPLDSSILAQGDGRTNAADLYHWAELRGRRMIWVDELPESERLKENAVKKLTGSSEISARSPGEKPFTFESQGKLWITTNHRPIITDDAMWRRIRPIPWMHAPETPDPTLKAYLHDPEGGLPAVLAWAIEGAKKLYASKAIDALGWCDVVKDAAEMYRQNEDRMGMFLEEETEEDVLATAPIKHIFLAYQEWSTDRGERPMSQIAFTRKIQDRGINITGKGGRAIVMGRRMKPIEKAGEIDWNLAQRIARD